MSAFRTLYHIAKAAYLDRVRRYGFLVTLAALLYAVYLFVPPNGSRYATMKLAEFRGEYNSAWVGMLVGLLTSTFLGIAGFYLIKNAIERDRHTGVGQILAATALSRPMYTLGKALSNFALLATMIALMMVAAGGMQMLRGEDAYIHLWGLSAPFLLLTLPMMAVVASVGVLFESLRFLRGGLGNAIYFILVMFLLAGTAVNRHLTAPINDLPGLGIAMPAIFSACEEAYPEYDREEDGFSMGFNIREESNVWTLRTFRWEGITWTADIVTGRLMWFVAAAALAIGLVIVEFLPRPAPTSRVEGRPVDTWLAAQPGNGAVVQLPYEENADSQAQIYYTLIHHKPLVGGLYGSFSTRQHNTVREPLASFPSAASAQLLEDLGVGFLMVDVAWYEARDLMDDVQVLAAAQGWSTGPVLDGVAVFLSRPSESGK